MSWTITKTESGIELAHTGATPIDPRAWDVESVVVAGGAVDVAVTDEALPFTVRLHSPEIAALWLPFVVGVAASDAALSAQDADDSAVIVAAFGSGHLTDVVRRFALGTWMHRWWTPADWIDRSSRSPAEWLLDAELGVLAHGGSVLFASEGVGDLFLTGAAESLATELQVRVGRHGLQAPTATLVSDSLATDRVATILAAAANAVLGRDLLAGERRDRLEAAESHFWDAREGDVGAISTLAELLAGAERTRVPWDIVMSGRDRDAPLDPAEVHPRSIRAPYFTWGRNGRVIRVEIESPEPGSVPIAEGELYARVEVGTETYAIPLEASPYGYSGEREIDTLAYSLTEIRVSVYSDRFSAGGRRGRDEDAVDDCRAELQEFAAKRAAITAAPVPDFSSPAAPFAIELAYLEG